MPEVNLTLIQTFYLVARHGSYSAAARELNLSYQSAANHVRRLEQVMHERLVDSDQGAKKIRLTPRGVALYNLLHPELEIMLERLSLVVASQRPVLRIGLPQAIFYYLLPAVLAQFHEKFPDVEVVAYERDTSLAELVKNGSLDVCINERFFGDPVVPQSLLGTYYLSLVYPGSWGPPPRAAEIPAWSKGRPLVTFEPGQTLRNMAMDFLAKGGGQTEATISASGSSSVKRCVENGLGFAIIPTWCVTPEDANLVKVKIDVLPPVKVYFGQALFMAHNIYVQALQDQCRASLIGAALERS
ncbi:MAG TPA: LysR family transcriptional regulator [Devosia sp.]|jgi:molybdate transport repressor ModE-like protein|uniref:LysR family transcriptional regulator n=1 Tax=Devosia sp. TaxID=1871048 RepID=UPI002DDD3DC8|nr:LysR family transcriptional regulator [Devosia sp.]HEV2515400.1 LysR family transcriptional regulator [Devosia sp.]